MCHHEPTPLMTFLWFGLLASGPIASLALELSGRAPRTYLILRAAQGPYGLEGAADRGGGRSLLSGLAARKTLTPCADADAPTTAYHP